MRSFKYAVDWARVNEVYGELQLEEDLEFFPGREGHLEHLVHEVGHALDLRLKVSSGVDNRVAERFDRLSRVASWDAEARVLAATARLSPFLNLRLTTQDLRWAASLQQVPAIVFDRQCATSEHERLARRIERWLLCRGVLRRTA